MEIDNGIMTDLGQKEIHVGAIILEQRLRKNCRTLGAGQHRKAGFIVGVTIAPVCTDRNLPAVIGAFRF